MNRISMIISVDTRLFVFYTIFRRNGLSGVVERLRFGSGIPLLSYCPEGDLPCGLGHPALGLRARFFASGGRPVRLPSLRSARRTVQVPLRAANK